MRNKVFIPQVPRSRDKASGDWIYKDLSATAAYGEPVVLLGAGPLSIATEDLVQDLHRGLVEFSDDDYLVAAGHPAAIAAAAAIAAEVNSGRLALLVWDNRLEQYIETRLDTRR